jgi:hypothetical protein
MRYKDLLEDVHQSLSSKILDILTPIAGNGIEFVTIDQIINKIRGVPTGLKVDREMIMHILDPNKFPLIKSIEGDKLYLSTPPAQRSINNKQKETEADKIKHSAEKQALNQIKGQL